MRILLLIIFCLMFFFVISNSFFFIRTSVMLGMMAIIGLLLYCLLGRKHS